MTRPVAVITGASSGLGRAFAERFAQRGYDLFLIARREERLRSLADELKTAHGIVATPLVLDLAEPNAAEVAADSVHSLGLSVDALVNCAGFGTAGPFVTENPARLAEELAVNVAAPTLLTRHFMPDLLTSPTGTLLMVASTAAHQPVPNLAAYAASKAFVLSLTAAIWKETHGTSLRTLAVCPGPTATEFFEAAGSETFKVGRVASIDEVIDATFRALDKSNAPVLTTGLGNKLRAFGAKLAPRRMTLEVGARSTKEDELCVV